MRPTAAGLAALLLCAGPVLAADGPEGRYLIDVQGTYQAMLAANVAKPDSLEILTQQREIMALVFKDDTLTFVTGPKLGNAVKGGCHWTLTGDALSFERCRASNGGSFSVDGTVLYDAGSGAVVIQGNAPVPIRYLAE